MRHTSVEIKDAACELIQIDEISPLISKCQIKVCYVDDEPNRNGTIITKETAVKIAKSLPGSPIVGKFNEEKDDYEEHNKFFSFEDGELVLSSDTRPYGFVDLNAKVWFQKYLDDNEIEREYLVTEGYLWTGRYPETQQLLDAGKGQSMELDEKNLSGNWTKDDKNRPMFFIINEAIISCLCILGDDIEPCFEGASITKPVIDFSMAKEFYTLMTEILKNEGGDNPMFTQFAMELGCELFRKLFTCVEATGIFSKDEYFYIDSIWEEDSGKKFAIVRTESKFYRADFDINDADVALSGDLVEVEIEYVPKEREIYETEAQLSYRAPVEEEKEEIEEEIEDTAIEEEKDEKIEEPAATGYKLEEISEYVELKAQYDALMESVENYKNQIAELSAFKASVEKKEKEALIDSFYMLSDEDKSDVVTNIDTYSYSDIEAKLAIICVRNKVSFDEPKDTEIPSVYTLDNEDGISAPAWVKALQETAKELE